MVTTAIWQVDSNSRYHISGTSSSSNRASSHKQQANHYHNQKTNEAEAAAAAAAAAVVAARAPSPQTNERRMAKRQVETPIIGSKGTKNTCCVSLQLGIVGTAGPIYCYSFGIMHVFVVLPAVTKKAPSALCLISHTPRRF